MTHDEGRGCALVIGGSGTLGGRIAALLAEREYAVVATFRSSPPTAPALDWVRFDVGDASGQVQLDDAIKRSNQPLKTIMYCVGMPSSKLPITATEGSEFERLYSVNALGLVRAYVAVLDHARVGAARVLAIGSDASSTTRAGNGAYSASKAALEVVARTLAKEEERFGVRVNVLAPCVIESPMSDALIRRAGVEPSTRYASLTSGRALSVDEAAVSAVSLACDDSWAYLSGAVIQLGALTTD